MGYDEIIQGDDFGDDDLDSQLGNLLGDVAVMGSAYNVESGNKARRQRAAINALIAKRVNDGALVRDVSPSKAREFIIGFGVTSVAASGSSTITQRPQVLFRPERVVIPSNIALDFMVTDIKVGKNSQFTANGEVPAVVFSETSFGVRLKMDTCQISMDITLSIRNLSANARNFTAAIIGPAVE